jgi:hypothetical protein
MTIDPYTECAQQLALDPDLVQRLLDDHAPRADGWCLAQGGHHQRHPCSIRSLAELAAGSPAHRTRGRFDSRADATGCATGEHAERRWGPRTSPAARRPHRART